jgi:putative hydrolase of the HAD superfamily
MAMVQLDPATGRRPVSAVLLDAMGTLVELDPPAPRLRDQLRERLGVEVSLAEAQAAMRAEIAHYRANQHAAGDRARLARLRRECARVVRDTIPELEPYRVGAVLPALLGAIRFTPYPDAEPALRRLRAAGVRRIVVSNWDISLHDVLASTDLDRLLDGVLASGELGVGKPSVHIFRHALAMAGAPADRVVHVGDRVDEDVEGARGAGIEAILLRRDGEPGPEGVRTIRSLTELPVALGLPGPAPGRGTYPVPS